MFGDTIKKLLAIQGKTQAELAAFVDVKQNTVSDWINQGTSPKIKHIYRIADFFSVSINYLFDEQDTSSKELNADDNKLLERYHTLDDDGKDIVRATVLQELRRMEHEKPLEVVARERGEGGGMVPGQKDTSTLSRRQPPPGKKKAEKKQA